MVRLRIGLVCQAIIKEARLDVDGYFLCSSSPKGAKTSWVDSCYEASGVDSNA